MAKKDESRWVGQVADLLEVGPHFDLQAVDPNATPGFDGKKKHGRTELAYHAVELSDLQEQLWAASTQGAPDRILLILQAMDTAGKGGIVRHVLSAVEPQGVQLTAFKAPTQEERENDFLWRIKKRTPTAGAIGVFDRSHYEDVLIQRVREMAPAEEIERRYGAINEFERELANQGTRIIKVMLRISKEEQKERLLARLDRQDKQWKFNPGDVDERQLWEKYDEAFQIVFDRTSTGIAPWHVIPANKKWYARIAVQQLLLAALRDINPQWPPVDYDVAAQRARLLAT